LGKSTFKDPQTGGKKLSTGGTNSKEIEGIGGKTEAVHKKSEVHQLLLHTKASIRMQDVKQIKSYFACKEGKSQI